MTTVHLFSSLKTRNHAASPLYIHTVLALHRVPFSFVSYTHSDDGEGEKFYTSNPEDAGLLESRCAGRRLNGFSPGQVSR